MAGALSGADALAMVNHGMLTVGHTVKEAYVRTLLVEEAGRILVAARSVGTPRMLSDEEVAAIRALPAGAYRIGQLRGRGGAA